MARYFAPDDVREDGPEDPPEDHAHNVHTCGWNQSLTVFRAAPLPEPEPCRPEFAERIRAAREQLARKYQQQKARGACI